MLACSAGLNEQIEENGSLYAYILDKLQLKIVPVDADDLNLCRSACHVRYQALHAAPLAQRKQQLQRMLCHRYL